MQHFRVALLQMTPCKNDQKASLEKGLDFCRQASRLQADLALFPEMWNCGYVSSIPSDWDYNVWRAREQWSPGSPQLEDLPALAEIWRGQAIRTDGEYVSRFRSLARELDMAIALTYLEEWTPLPRNVVSIIDRRGEILLTYAKVHTCAFSPAESALTPGNNFFTCSLETAGGEVNVGAMICFDREFPESARLLMLKGAEIILTPNACEMEQHRTAQFKTRAFENMTGMALANYAGGMGGRSMAFDPVAFDQNGSRDNLIIEAGEEEGVFLADFDLDQIRNYRQRETWGNAFRKPHLYSGITSMAVNEPFVRVNQAGERFDKQNP